MRRAVGVVGLVILVIGCGGGYHKRGVTDAAADFKQFTGFELPQSARLVAADDTHLEASGPTLAFGPGVLDGRFLLIFDADLETLKKWLSGPAPWGTEWRQGPVPDEISPFEFRDNEHLVPLVQTTTIRFAAHARGSNGTSWHDGELMVIDSERGRVWLLKWDT
jgi:hypothetical protein